jgi:putative flippase GtrA
VENFFSQLQRQKIQFQTEHREKILFLLVGAVNTVFGIVLYWVLLYLFGTRVNYLVLLIPNQLIAVTVAFFLYKHFVFNAKTERSLLGSYVRFFTVSTLNAMLGCVLVFLLVHGLHMHPAYANAITVILVAVLSYICHKYISFRT